MRNSSVYNLLNQLSINSLNGINFFQYNTINMELDVYSLNSKKMILSNPDFYAIINEFENNIDEFMAFKIDQVEMCIPLNENDNTLKWLNVIIQRNKADITCVMFDVTNRELRLRELEKENEHLLKKISVYDYLYSGDQLKIDQANQELNKVAKRLIRANKLAIKSGKVMIWFQDNTEFDMVKYFYGNELFISKLGLESVGNGLITRRSYHETLYDNDEEGRALKEVYLSKVRKIAAGEIDRLDAMIVKFRNLKTGEIIYCEQSSEVEARYADGSVMIDGGFLVDVSERIKQEKTIRRIADQDLLTNLYNRNYMAVLISENKLPSTYMLVIADVDGLKLINDAFGHIKGDLVIQIVARTLKQFYPDSIVARMGGDEFLVISMILDEVYHENSFNKINELLQIESLKMNVDIRLSLGSCYVDKAIISYDEAFIAAENLMYRRKLSERNSRKSNTLEIILSTLNARSVETHEHSFRLSKYAVQTLKKLGHTRTSDAEDITLLARVHDIGKINIPDSILLKNGKLTVEEYKTIKTHSEAGYKIIKSIVNSEQIADGVYYHHERIDGNGYPMGLKGNEIPIFAKIIAVCDVYDAMTSGRIYQKAKTSEEAIEELYRCSGTQFDTEVVEAFISALDESVTSFV